MQQTSVFLAAYDDMFVIALGVVALASHLLFAFGTPWRRTKRRHAR